MFIINYKSQHRGGSRFVRIFYVTTAPAQPEASYGHRKAEKRSKTEQSDLTKLGYVRRSQVYMKG